MDFETGLLLWYPAAGLQVFPAAADRDHSQMRHIVQMSNLSEYDLGGEGDLFKAPEPIFEEPVLELDPVTSVISLISGVEDINAAETINTENAPFQHEQFLSELFLEFEKKMLAQSAITESSLSEEADQITAPGNLVRERNNLVAEGPLQKSVSTRSLNSVDWLKNCALEPEAAKFQALDSGSGLRRAYSEGDIQTFGSVNFNLRNISIGLPTLASSDLKIEDKIKERRQKLSRYWKKKTQRNFGRKIKYACRKALADVQPRVRGRFAKTEVFESPKQTKAML